MPKRIGDHDVFDKQIAAAKIIREQFGHAFRAVIETFRAALLFAETAGELDADNRGAAPVIIGQLAAATDLPTPSTGWPNWCFRRHSSR